MAEKILFKETQRFSFWWIWLILIAIPLPLFYILRSNSGDFSISIIMPMENWIGILFLLIFIIFIGKAKLKTTFTKGEIKIQHLHFYRKTITFKEVKNCKIVTHNFVGYGLRKSSKYGTVLKTKGNKGLLVTQINGKKFLIGTQKPKTLEDVLKIIFDNV